MALFRWKAPGDPVLEEWLPESARPSWKLIRRVDVACASVAGEPFLHLDVRTPYGEPVSEDQVLPVLREALGPQADNYLLQGWHVAHLEDTHLGSNHRVFASLSHGTRDFGSDPWDTRLPLEMAVESLGEWIARRTGRAFFQLVMAQGEWIYSLAYRDAQPFHLIRVAADPGDFALKRLREHREYLRQSRDSENPPLYLESGDTLRAACEQALGINSEAIPRPAGFPADADPALWCLGLALAALREETAGHNLVPGERRERNLEIRIANRWVKGTVLAAALGLAVIGGEGLRTAQAGRDLRAIQSEATRYAEKVSAIQELRKERRQLLDSLARLKPLWSRPLPMDRVLRALARSLPPESGIEGVLVRKTESGRAELSFRAWVKDWNSIRPFQERLQRLPFFTAVEFSDQRKDVERQRVAFQASCILGGGP